MIGLSYDTLISCGVILSVLFGKFGEQHKVLIILIIIDYITGVFIAALGKSPKSDTGALSSYASWKGILKKVLTILLVAACHQCDVILGTEYIANIAIYGLCANELLSIVENYSMSGGYVPDVLYKAIEVLKKRGEENEDSSTRGA